MDGGGVALSERSERVGRPTGAPSRGRLRQASSRAATPPLRRTRLDLLVEQRARLLRREHLAVLDHHEPAPGERRRGRLQRAPDARAEACVAEGLARAAQHVVRGGRAGAEGHQDRPLLRRQVVGVAAARGARALGLGGRGDRERRDGRWRRRRERGVDPAEVPRPLPVSQPGAERDADDPPARSLQDRLPARVLLGDRRVAQRAVALHRHEAPVLLGDEVDAEARRRVLGVHVEPAGPQRVAHRRAERAVLRGPLGRQRRRLRDRAQVHQPVAQRARPGGGRELLERRGVVDPHLVARPGERDVEHPLHVLLLRLARRELRLRHALAVVRQRVEDHVALVALEAVRVDHHQAMLPGGLLVDGLRDELLQQPHLLLEQADDADRRAGVGRVAQQLREAGEQRPGLRLVLLRAWLDAAVRHLDQPHRRAGRVAVAAVARVAHEPQPPAVPAPVGERDQRRQRAEVLVQQHLLVGAHRRQPQQVGAGRVEPAVGVVAREPVVVRGLRRHGLGGEGEAARLHLARVARDDGAPGAEEDGRHRGQVALGRLVDHHDVEQPGRAGEEPRDVVRRHHPARQHAEQRLAAVRVGLEAVEDAEVLRLVAAPEDRRELAQAVAVDAARGAEAVLCGGRQQVDGLLPQRRPGGRLPLAEHVRRHGRLPARPPARPAQAHARP